MTVLREMVANNIHQQINKIFPPVFVQYSVRLFAPSIKTNYNPLHKVFFFVKKGPETAYLEFRPKAETNNYIEHP